MTKDDKKAERAARPEHDSYRLLNSDGFSVTYDHETKNSPDAVEGEGYFNSWHLEASGTPMLRARDTVIATCRDGDGFARAEIVVTHSERGKVVAKRNGAWFRSGPAEEKPEDAPEPGAERYVQGDGEVKWISPGAKYGVFDGGKKVASGIEDRGLAESIAAGSMPIPE